MISDWLFLRRYDYQCLLSNGYETDAAFSSFCICFGAQPPKVKRESLGSLLVHFPRASRETALTYGAYTSVFTAGSRRFFRKMKVAPCSPTTSSEREDQVCHTNAIVISRPRHLLPCTGFCTDGLLRYTEPSTSQA